MCRSCRAPVNGAASFCARCGAPIRGTELPIVPRTGGAMQPWNTPGTWRTDAPPDYAGFWVRFAALLIDGLVLAIPSVIVAITIIGPVLVMWLYTAFMMSSSKQGTLGMMAMGLRVTDDHGNRLTFGKATARYFASILSSLIFYIGFLMLLGNKRKQTLHDQMAGTLILRGRGNLLEGGDAQAAAFAPSPSVIETPQQRAARQLDRCDQLIVQVEQDSVALDLLPSESPLRQHYLSALQLRADGVWMAEHAATPASQAEAEKKIAGAVEELIAVRDGLIAR